MKKQINPILQERLDAVNDVIKNIKHGDKIESGRSTSGDGQEDDGPLSETIREEDGEREQPVGEGGD